MARGHIVARDHNVNGNVMGRANTIPIVDTRMYQVEFTGGADVIAELIYTQCNTDRNEYLLLDVRVVYQKDNKAISIMDQHNTVWG